ECGGAIAPSIRWLGFDWAQHPHHASVYFEQLHLWAVQLSKAGKSYVGELTHEQMREARGTLTEAGTESPYRNRPVAESLDLLERMRRGEFDQGSETPRANIHMGSGNINLRDPVVYRTRKAAHQPTGAQCSI